MKLQKIIIALFYFIKNSSERLDRSGVLSALERRGMGQLTVTQSDTDSL